MLTTSNDIKTDVIVKLGVNTTEAYYTDTILNSWVKQATRWATSYKKWPLTEGRISTTFVAGTEEWNFEGYKGDSFRIVQIGGKRLQKLNFDDYQIFREVEPSSNNRVYSDFGRTVFINPNIDLSGTLTAYGQYTPVDIDMTDLTSTTVFSNSDEEANEAIVDEVLSYANTREKKDVEAKFYHDKATNILDNVWQKFQDEQYAYQTSTARGGMFKRINILGGDVDDELLHRDRFPLS